MYDTSSNLSKYLYLRWFQAKQTVLGVSSISSNDLRCLFSSGNENTAEKRKIKFVLSAQGEKGGGFCEQINLWVNLFRLTSRCALCAITDLMRSPG